ncbi:MAG: type II secretion system protein [Planctomycetota bacterium]|jgi:prepilin-type N-terminal cleavage/methylation domain-containing protein
MYSVRKSTSAFTLIELLVVIAIIALLLSIIMPGLGAAKRQAQGIVCQAHLKGLSQAWLIYAEENNDQIVGARTGSSSRPEYSWAEAPQDEDGNSTSVNSTVEEKINGIEKGLLYSYAETYEVYRCPADKRHKKTVSAGTGMGGYRNGRLPKLFHSRRA